MSRTPEIGVVGDVHGAHAQLVDLIESLPQSVRTLVFVGDLVNRGARSREVLDYCVELKKTRDVLFVRGNHDEEFLRFVDSGNIRRFLAYGGASTLRSYFDEFAELDLDRLNRMIPPDHVDLLRSMEAAVVLDELGVTHRSTDPLPASAVVRYRISGHHPTGSGQPIFESDHAHIDTGCGTFERAPLTCVTWPGLGVVQSFG